MKNLFVIVATKRTFTFKHRLVWSAVLLRNRIGQPGTKHFVRKRFGLGLPKLNIIFRQLAKLGLVEERGEGKFWALEPTGENAALVRWKKERSGKWQSDMRYFVVRYGESKLDAPWTVRGLWGFLLSKKSGRSSLNKIADGVGASRNAIREGLRRLERLGLLSFSCSQTGVKYEVRERPTLPSPPSPPSPTHNGRPVATATPGTPPTPRKRDRLDIEAELAKAGFPARFRYDPNPNLYPERNKCAHPSAGWVPEVGDFPHEAYRRIEFVLPDATNPKVVEYRYKCKWCDSDREAVEVWASIDCDKQTYWLDLKETPQTAIIRLFK